MLEKARSRLPQLAAMAGQSANPGPPPALVLLLGRRPPEMVRIVADRNGAEV